MAEEHNLPGWPSKSLVRKVKSELWRTIRSRPQINDRLWRLTWEWANNCAHRRDHWLVKASRSKWPPSNEIAGQFIFLAMAELFRLRLPMYAEQAMPAAVQEIVNERRRMEQIAGGWRPGEASEHFLRLTSPGVSA